MTVLILGAGTSLDYGYPSGMELVDRIVQRLESGENSKYSPLLQDLNNYKPYSIDSFLHKFPKHDVEAKALIAEILFECENPDKKVSPQKDFYRFLFHEIPEEEYEKFKIITFNYDRSLEYHFSKSLLPSKGTEEEAFKALDKLEIIHIHGRLPALPFEKRFQMPTDRNQYPYGFGANGYYPTNDFGHLVARDDSDKLYFQHQANDNRGRIKVYGQKNFKTVFQNSEVHSHAKKIIENADRVFFLGFGYHELNMKLLGYNWKTIGNKKIYGTCHKISRVRKSEVKDIAPAVSLLDCDNMTLFSHHHSLSKPELEVLW